MYIYNIALLFVLNFELWKFLLHAFWEMEAKYVELK